LNIKGPGHVKDTVSLVSLHCLMLEIEEMVISAFIGLIGLGPASRVFTCSLLDRYTKMPHMTLCSNSLSILVGTTLDEVS